MVLKNMENLLADLDKDAVGAKYLKVFSSVSFSEMCSNVIVLPLSEHWRPEVKLTKKYGIKNLTDYDTLEEVKDKGQEMIGSRLVITVKETHDGQKQQCKSRLVA